MRTLFLAPVLLVACSSMNPAHLSRVSQSTAAGPSYVGQAVQDALVAAFPGEQGATWQLSSDNTLSDGWLLQMPSEQYWGGDVPVAAECTSSNASCDPDFKLSTCASDADCSGGGSCVALNATVAHDGDSPRSLCVGHSDQILDQIYGVITGAQTRVDISSLGAPDGRYEATIRNAITRLSGASTPPSIRLVFGNYLGQFGSASKTLKSLTRDVAPTSTIQVSVGMYRDGMTSWNHSKIIAADGNVAIVGGMNLWTEHYLSSDPVHDVSIRVNGSAVATAHLFLNRIWDFVCNDYNPLDHAMVATFPGSTSSCLPDSDMSAVPPAGGNVTVIAAGRLGAIGPESSDAALVAMLGAARTSIRIAQQDIGPPKIVGLNAASWPLPVLDALVAALGRGVDVQIIVSNVGATPGGLTGASNGYGNGWSPADVAQHITDEATAHPELWTGGQDVTATLCSHLHVATLSASGSGTWGDGAAFALHAKVVEVDDLAFYVGSQNLYTANLAEFGMIVDDTATTQDFESRFLDKAWSYSSAGAVTGGGAACSQSPGVTSDDGGSGADASDPDASTPDTSAPPSSDGGPSGPDCTGLLDGNYCGSNQVNGDPGTLYTCSGGQLLSSQVCPTSCVTDEAGAGDVCN